MFNNVSIVSRSRDIFCQSGLFSDSTGDDPATVERYQTLVLAVEELSEEVAEVHVSQNGAGAISRRAVGQVNATEELLERLEAQLAEAEQLLEGDGMRTMREALDAQQAAGQQSEQLTDVAREARQFADV